VKRDKIGILSLGCPRNLVDSESILGRLCKKGYQVTDMDKADIGIINTCAFIEEAKKESIDAILDLIDLKKEGRLKKVIVYGCLPQRYRQKLQEELPEIDAFAGKISLNHDSRNFSITPAHYAYLKICEGCINACSFCVIPKIKGKFTSLDMNSVVKRAKDLDSAGASEINIIGQDISGYGRDLYGECKLTEVLGKITKTIKNTRWIRLLYLYPSRVNDELLDFIKDEPRICKYIDLPIQHINGRILKLMRRKTAKKDIVRLIDKIRKKIPQVAIRTSVIAGFPSETEAEFKELLDFIKEIKFERLGAFTYSREEDTAAYNFKQQVPERVKLQRLNAVMQEQQRVSEEVNRKFLGQEIDVLIDEEEKGTYLGRSQFDAPEVDGIVYVKSSRKLMPGDLLRVKITDTLEYDLTGEVC